ncbi:unnamed protein product, partial [Mesorhabditis belari]|uniref:Gelsolin-like domain-containing protein n=1 Tax=Mesorhabditis belari TaxID=2138241 RepID=A0AAF3EAL5_9BILA
MATTGGVLSFVKGIDFSRNDFSGDRFPHELEACTQMTWLKLNRSQLERVPDELSRLTNLEHLQMSRNSLTSVHGELSDLPRLRSVIVRHNNIKTSGIPTDIFRMKDLTIIDFSHNQLREVPPNLEYAKGAIVMNLSYNNIENIPNQVFANLVDLIHVDLSNNKIDMLPPQIRRLTLVQVLLLSNNPMSHFQLKQLPSMKALRVLHMRNTNRTLDNIPPILDDLENLMDVDFAENNLPKVPEALYKLKKLRKLDLSGNKISKIELSDGFWESLETLNLSSNELTVLPEGIIRMTRLQRLYANNNKLTFEGIPSGIGKLIQLTVLHMSHNNLELVPEGLSRCVKLQRLRLDHNRLFTLPEGIHLLPDLAELHLHGNEDLVVPPKPSEKRRALAFYNIDFSLQGQMRMVGQLKSEKEHSSTSSIGSAHKDVVQRKKDFIRRRRHQADENSADKVIKGMTKIAGATAEMKEREREEQENAGSLSKPQNWKAHLERSRNKLDYSDIFEEDVGTSEGLWMWEIDKFYPSLIEPEFHGQFFEADAYLVLNTTVETTGQLKHEIYYWLGEHASLDRAMCAAMHAVGLRNHLNATCRTTREEQNEESVEFLSLFGDEIIYLEGARTTSGFFTVEKKVHKTRLYRVSVNGTAIEMEPVGVSSLSLDPRYAFLLDAEKTIWLWSGKKSRITVANKARLFAERMNKRDRKGAAAIENCSQSQTPEEFWLALTGVSTPPEDPIVEHVPDDFVPERMRLYLVQIGMGFLELPQVELKHGVAKQEMLQTKCVYLLDCSSDVYLWTGKKAGRLLKMAGQRLLTELYKMLQRPEHAEIIRENEGEESTMFRSKFASWDDIIPVDFTRTADSVQRRGADTKIILERDKMKTDLTHLFLERNPPMSSTDSEELLKECNEDLELIEGFVLEGKKFVRLPEQEFGTFYTTDCYVFLCRYAVYGDDDTDLEDEEEAPDEKADDFKCVVYFWQGREASNMGWLHFTFSLQQTFERLFKDKLEVVRMHQQQENHKFLAHFNKKFLIRSGKRRPAKGEKPVPKVELFHMRANGSSLCTRTIQVKAKATSLCSGFCYILHYEPTEEMVDDLEKTWVWIGNESDVNEHTLLQEIAEKMIHQEETSVEIIKEGDEPEEFWERLGGHKRYKTDASFMNYTRLFRCSNEKGYFSVSEKTVDFCQDDLNDDDVMILDNGIIVYLWLGSKASDVEIKLSYKAVNVYTAHLRMKQPDRPRTIMATLKGRETHRFTKCFHAWGNHKNYAVE